MKKIILILLIVIIGFNKVISQINYADSLLTVDPELKKYFPRWKICEPDLQFQIYNAFIILGYAKNELDLQNIEILAGPKEKNNNKESFEVLELKCGKVALTANQIDRELSSLLPILSGDEKFRKVGKTAKIDESKSLDYCFSLIKPETPLTYSQAEIIKDYYKPTNVTQALHISAFEQILKIGKSDFWLINKVGSDEIGLPFYLAGESKIIMQRPLYLNSDLSTAKKIPNLIELYLGGSYKINSGIANEGTLFSWLPKRYLNGNTSGKIITGVDVHMPFMPEFGIHANVEIPLSDPDTKQINLGDFATYTDGTRSDLVQPNLANPDFNPEKKIGIASVIKTTGQITLFYNWWLDDNNAENYFRFDLGANYVKVDEYLLYINKIINNDVFISNKNLLGLNSYANSNFSDWLYFKVDYRNQAAFPFGVSFQISNQTLFSKLFIPLISNWFLLEAKYVTPLREKRPYEIGNFFMLSPVLRITI